MGLCGAGGVGEGQGQWCGDVGGKGQGMQGCMDPDMQGQVMQGCRGAGGAAMQLQPRPGFPFIPPQRHILVLHLLSCPVTQLRDIRPPKRDRQALPLAPVPALSPPSPFPPQIRQFIHDLQDFTEDMKERSRPL